MRRIGLFLVCLLLLAGCKDFNPATESSVRTVRFRVDPSEVMDSMCVTEGDSVVFRSIEVLPEGYCLRTEVLCYRGDGSLVRSGYAVSDSVTPFVVQLTHIDTSEMCRCFFVTDVVRKLEGGMYEYTWPTYDVSMMNQAYMMYVRSYAGTEPWMNALGYAVWNGRPRTSAIAVRMQRMGCPAVLTLEQADEVDKVQVDVGMPRSVWLFGPKSRRRIWNEGVGFSPSARSVEMPFVFANIKDKVSLNVITRSVNTIDTTTVELEDVGERPFRVRFDCVTKKFEKEDL